MRRFIERNYCNVDQSIAYICKNEYKYFLKRPYVVGIGLGYKRKNNFYTCEKCIQVFVVRKLPKSEISANDMIPITYKGIKTDVIETGVFVPSELRNKKRPVPGGYSIAPRGSISECSIGCVVTNGVLKFVLSVAHVLSDNNELSIGYEIIQPPYLYGGRSPQDNIAKLNKYIPLRFSEMGITPTNLLDVALAVLSEPGIVKPEIAFIGKATCVKSPKLNSDVKKVGCVTELTEGRITSVNATVEIQFIDKLALFTNTIMTTKMGEVGDSGSLLLNRSNCGVGILHGTSGNANVACRLDLALDSLDVKLV